MSKPTVSILCITYNHEKFIADAIEGFVKQKTDFEYEIIIHDDASTDKTAEIIRKYQQKYPDIINAVLQTENQFSKGVRILNSLCQSVESEFIAVCEGDDYWTDPLKLQKQVDCLRKNTECAGSATASQYYNCKTGTY